MLRRATLLLLPALAAVTLSCGDKSPTGSGSAANVAGLWTYFEVLTSAALQLTCDDQGTLDISQTGTQFTGAVVQSGSCVTPEGSFDNSGSVSTQGTVTDTTIAFRVQDCRYQGKLFGTPVDSVAGSVSCTVRQGLQTYTVAGRWFAVKGIDLDPPDVTGVIAFPAADTLFVPSDTLRLTLSASDDRRVRWAGYRLGPPANVADSVAALAPSVDRTFALEVPGGWVGASTVTVFARDALGRSVERPAGTVRVLDAVRRPFRTMLLDALATDVAYDAKRDVLYLAQLEASKIGVLALGPFTLGAPITPPGPPATSRGLQLDVTPGGDSLVTPIATPAIAFVDLVTGAIDTVHITSDTGTTDFIGEAHTLANQKVFTFGSWSTVGTLAYAIFEYDIATADQARRTDVGINGNVGATSERARSGDHARFLLLDKNRGCGQVYAAAADAFGACVSVPFPVPATPTGTATGDRWLAGNLVLDGALTVEATLASGLARGGIAPDGTAAYYPTAYGYQRVRLPDGLVTDRVRIPVPATRVTVLPDGRRLVIWSDPGATSELLTTNRITVVSLQ